MRRLKIIPLLGFTTLLTACGGDMSDLEQFIDETKLRHHGKVDPLPEFPPYQTFTYEALDVRDPFRPQTDLNHLLLSPRRNITDRDLKRLVAANHWKDFQSMP